MCVRACVRACAYVYSREVCVCVHVFVHIYCLVNWRASNYIIIIIVKCCGDIKGGWQK